MGEITYNTKAECLKAIETVKALGMKPAAWMLKQLAALEKAEQLAALVQDSDTPIWDTLQANYPYGLMPEEKKECVESTVEQLLEEGPHADEPGLLLGKIQCGKTDTFEDIIGLSFDKGVDVAIVITKGTKALVNQTIRRMEKDYRFFKPSDDLDQKSCIDIFDIMSVWKSMKQSTVESRKIVIVCKKNADNLKHLMDLFITTCPCLQQKKILIVDDEADFASRNYVNAKPEVRRSAFGKLLAQKKELEMAKISQQIDDFRKIPAFCRYLQVTATPYCLYLQPQGDLNLNGNVVKPFKPRFTSLVPIHPFYIGGQQYFVDSQDSDSMYSHLFHQIDEKCIDVLGHEDKDYFKHSIGSGTLFGLTYSLIAYFMATAVRRIQKRAEKKNYNTSAVFHVEIDKKNHEWQYRVVSHLINGIKKAILKSDTSDQRIWGTIDLIYEDFVLSNEKGRKAELITVALPEKEKVIDELRSIFDPANNNYSVQMVNSDEKMDSMLDSESGELKLECAANIFIGGNILDRGVTIKNMLCFFYGRNPNGFQTDTVLQHARMYGARSKEDMAVMRLHTTDKIYNVLKRMNDLDDQLRQWFIEGKDQLEPNAVFVGFTKDIKPCASQKYKASNALILKPQHTMVPVGFWTGTQDMIGKTVSQIESLIENSPNYGKKDEDGFFEMTKDEVADILKLILTTYTYSNTLRNIDHKNDIKEMLCALEYCADKSGGRVYVLHRKGRGMSRIRKNGNYIDAPQDGRDDMAPSRKKAIDAPVVMLLGQMGAPKYNEKDPTDKTNYGWNDAPFYWPVLLSQEQITPVMFAIDQSRNGLVVKTDGSDILDGINPEEVLNMTFSGDLEERFGPVDTEYSEQDEDRNIEIRAIRDTTASRYLEKDEKGDWKINPNVAFDKEHYHGVYSRNNDVFPFVLIPFKYLLLRNRRDARADEMLLELFEPSQWIIMTSGIIDEKGDLYQPDDNKDIFLCHTTDTIIDKDLSTEEKASDTFQQWAIGYKVKKVLKFRKCELDLDQVIEDTEAEDNNPVNFGYRYERTRSKN